MCNHIPTRIKQFGIQKSVISKDICHVDIPNITPNHSITFGLKFIDLSL